MGYILIIIHIIVPNTSNISIKANTLFLNLNCIGVKIMLKSKFRKKGRAIKKDILPLYNSKNIYPKDISMSMYRKLHTVPNTQLGGDHLGFLIFEYQLVLSIYLNISLN